VTREFIILPEFDKLWKSFGLKDDDLQALQEFLCLQPDYGDVIEATGGIRKLRWALRGSGKRGGIRILYVDFVSYEKTYLITAYKKNVKLNLTKREKQEIRKLVYQLRDELRKNTEDRRKK